MADSSREKPKSREILLRVEMPEPGADLAQLVSEFRTLADELRAAIAAATERGEPHSWDEATASAELGISEITLIRLRRAGKISYTPVGKKARYTRKHLEEYLDRNTFAAS